MPSIYVETTIPSYLAASPSRDSVTAVHQEITWEWWNRSPADSDLYISEMVWDEISIGRPDMVQRRCELVSELPVLARTPDVDELIDIFVARLGLPPASQPDVVHIAFCVSYRMDYLVTWNCRHLANAAVIHRLNDVTLALGRPSPVIVTPESMLSLLDEDHHVD